MSLKPDQPEMFDQIQLRRDKVQTQRHDEEVVALFVFFTLLVTTFLIVLYL